MKKEISGPGPRILIVDDHRISRQFVVSVLRRNAIPVGQACNAREAISIARTWLPHVILMDVSLAGDSGYATARRIRAQWPSDRPLPGMIMLSADPPQRHPPRANAEQTDTFLLKPFSAGQLMDAVHALYRPARPGPCRDETLPRGLPDLFRAELASKLAPLECALAAMDLPTARGILHQLIASSALCRQRKLERDLRALHRACGGSAPAAALARPYFSLLANARDFLAGD